jgi:CheY-like chemotaxis protein
VKLVGAADMVSMAGPLTQEKSATGYASEIAASLRGALILPIGFERSEFLRIAGVLSSAGAVVAEGSFGSPAIASCQAIVVRIAALAGTQGGPMPPILIVGTPREIAANTGSHFLSGADFLTTPWTAPELIVRIFRLIALSPQGQARVQGRGRPRVLIADDDPNITELLMVNIGNHADCRVARNGLATLQAIREFPPDVLILDIDMPILNGFEVLETIRADPGLRRLPVILLTASDERDHVVKGLGLGANDYVVKPFGLNGLIRRIRHILVGSLVSGPATANASGPAL